MNKEESCELELCESCRQLKRRLTCILHETSLLNFLTKEEKPFLRVAFSPALGRFPLGDPADPWEPALRRLVDLDDVPLVITERTTADIGAATERLEELGFENIARGPEIHGVQGSKASYIVNFFYLFFMFFIVF